MKYVHIIMLIFFLAAAVFSAQGPDKLIWIAVYGFVMFSTVLAYFGNYKLVPLITGIGILVFYLAQISPPISAELVETQLGKKSIGLMIAIFWLVILFGIGLGKRMAAQNEADG